MKQSRFCVRLRLTVSNCSLEIVITAESPARKLAWPILVSVYVQLNLLHHSAEIWLNSFRKSLAISRRAAEIFSPRCPVAISAFRIFDIPPTWIVGDPHAFRSFILSRIKSSILSQKLCTARFPEFCSIFISLSQNDPSAWFWQITRVPSLLFLNFCLLTVTHLLSDVEKQLSRHRFHRRDLRRIDFFSFPIYRRKNPVTIKH